MVMVCNESMLTDKGTALLDDTKRTNIRVKVNDCAQGNKTVIKTL